MLKLNLRLPNDIKSVVWGTMIDEYRVAQKKWRVKCSPEQRSLVFTNATKQLFSRVNDLPEGITYDQEENTICICALGSKDKEEVVDLDEASALPKSLTDLVLVRGSGKWVIKGSGVSVNPIEEIPLTKLYGRVLDYIQEAARTAIFYGVGSFA